ncbi:precursor of CEP [Salix suchowensis]|nr:precursor of CEP [Salix suchowensis]
MVTGAEARPFSGSKLNKDADVGEVEGFAGGFYLQAVKKSGPSPGIGHKYENFQIEGEATRSVPSPEEVHEHGNKP